MEQATAATKQPNSISNGCGIRNGYGSGKAGSGLRLTQTQAERIEVMAIKKKIGLNKLKSYIISEMETGEPDFSSIVDAIQEYRRTQMPQIERIEAAACEIYNISLPALKSKVRLRSVVSARDLVYWYLINKQDWTLSAIAKRYNRNHATVLHSVKKISGLIDIQDRAFEFAFNRFVDEVNKIDSRL